MANIIAIHSLTAPGRYSEGNQCKNKRNRPAYTALEDVAAAVMQRSVHVVHVHKKDRVKRKLRI